MLTNRGVPKLRVDIFLRGDMVKETNPNNLPWKLATFNASVAFFHFIQFFIVAILLGVRFNQPSDSPVSYVAGKQQLHMTNQAVVPSADVTNQCVLDNNKAESNLVVLVDYTNQESILDKSIYDFSNVIIYQYYEVGSLPISTPAIVMTFFLFSAAFQALNYWLLRDNSDQPRMLHYIEYSITGSMCLVVMAVNVGIREVTVITGLFGLFFGVNMLGACAELLVYAAEQHKQKKDVKEIEPFLMHNQTNLWTIAHIASWILFFFAMGPLLDHYTMFYVCSERKVPDYMHAIVVVEMLAFLAFGKVQLWGLLRRMELLHDGGKLNVVLEGYAWFLEFLGRGFYYMAYWPAKAFGHTFTEPLDNAVSIIYYMDLWMISLSLVAKTSLAWLLLAPALAVNSYDRRYI